MEEERNEAIEFFKLDASKKTIVVIGGSQGARSINHSLRDGLKKFADKNVQLIWQTGKLFFPDAEKVIADLKYEGIKAFDFITKMDLAYAAADLIISRAGASTVSEITLVGKPAVMVPLATAAEDHQTKNILALVQKDAAIMVKDSEAKEKLVDTALQLVFDNNKLKQLSENVSTLALRNSAERIAQEVISIVNRES